MQRGNHKRVRTSKETNGFSSALSNGTPANHENKATWGPSKSSAASDPFVIPNLLERLADGKYGSVTKEYESIHGRVSSFLSALRYSVHGFNTQNVHPSYPPVSELGGTPADAQKHSEPLAEEIASFHGQALGQESGIGNTTMQKEMPELPSPQDPITGNGVCHAPIIVIDSDDDMEPREDQNARQSGDEPLAVQLWQPDHPNVTHESYQGACLDLCNHGSTVAGVVGWQPSIQYQKVDLMNLAGNCPYPDLVGAEQATPLLSPFSVTSNKIKGKGRGRPKGSVNSVKRKTEQVNADGANLDAPQSEKAIPSGKGDTSEALELDDLQPQSPDIESPVESDREVAENDGLGDLWQEMSLAMEFSKTVVSDQPESEDEDECEHLFVMKDDLGVVCRVCGIIQKSIEKIVDYQLTKSSRATRVYSHESRHNKDSDGIPSLTGPKAAEHDLFAAEIAIHPRHEKQMKPHQLEGFCFLVRNLVTDKPGGCILAHAPGSGKTFMLISFLQSFLAKYPFARPLVVLPKGILAIWKKEFGKWQVEDIPLYDFYSVKADNRSQQLEVLKNWEDNKSILLMGYKQFANIVCGGIMSEVAAACQERLLKIPSLLIIDEGHTPRNDNTDVLMALSRVETPRKVVLSGTLFQNHVKEVFNILNLVRPKFLKMDSSRAVVTRIMSRVRISGSRRVRPDVNTSFYELVEETLQCESDLKRKVAIIRDLREMTQHVLHYYKGDFLEELPGLVDFTVMLKLSARQKQIIRKLGKLDKFKRSAVCRAIYMHPSLNEISENVTGDKSCDLNEEKIDNIIGNLDIRDGVKTKFFLNILSLCVSAGEKLLVFSQYLLPLKFLERLVARLKGWRSGREMFMISGDSSPDQRESAMEQFNNSDDAKLFFGSIKACGEGISLVGASRVIILDVHLNPSVSRQAIGRAFRPGQIKKVHVYRLVAADSAEEEDHNTSFRKELTSKMWFEWSEYSHNQDFEMEKVDIEDSEDMFFESTLIAEDVNGLYRR